MQGAQNIDIDNRNIATHTFYLPLIYIKEAMMFLYTCTRNIAKYIHFSP